MLIKEFILKKFLFSLLLLAMAIQGCIPKYQGDTIFHKTGAIEKALLEKNYTLVAQQQKADIGNFWVFYIPVNLEMPKEEGEIEHTLADKLLQRFDGDLLTNVKFESSWLITVYWNQFKRHITADVWKKKD